MGIKGFFQPKLDQERERSLQDPDQILAWLEDLQRNDAPLEIKFERADLLPLAASVVKVDEEGGSFTLGLRRPPTGIPAAGRLASVAFPMDGLRFQTEAAYQGRGRYLEYRFALPTAIRFAERRDSFRVRFRTREHYQAIVLEDILGGVGLMGRLVDLAMGGCALQVERAMRVQSSQRLALDQDLLSPGAPVALVRLGDLPKLPMLEFSGRVSHFHRGHQGLILGVAFGLVGAREHGLLGRFMADRLPGFRADFPRKRRTRDLLVAQPEEPAPAEGAEPEAPLPEPEPEPEPCLEAEPGAQPERLRMLRKFGKRILLVHADELERTILASAFRADGYRQVHEARSLVQALDLRRRVGPDLVLVDQALGPHTGLEVVDTLRRHGLSKQVPVVVLQRKPEVRLTLAAKAGGISFLADHPVDFQGPFRERVEALLGLDPPAGGGTASSGN